MKPLYLLTILIPVGSLIGFLSCHKKDYPYGPPPEITAIGPDSGHFSTVLTLTGRDFNSVASGNTVLIDSVPATVLYASTDSLVVSVPTTHTGNVIVKTLAGSSTGPVFKYLADVFVCGNRTDFTYGSSYQTALYWENGTPVQLTNGSSNAGACCIVAPADDIYVGGYEYSGGSEIATIWKNGVATTLNSPSQNGEVDALAVSGSDIYAAGFLRKGGNTVAALWKNGNLTLLADSTGNTDVTGIVIAGGSIYLSGYKTDATQTQSQALLWQNGQIIRLTDTTDNARANCVAISGNDIYAGGFESLAAMGFANDYPTYWKNGTPFFQTGTSYGYVNSIALSNNVVYMVGYDLPEYSSYAMAYWTSAPVFVGLPSASGVASAIVIDSTDIYIAGEELNGGYYKAHYWKNGADSLLDKSSSTVSTATFGLFVRH